MDINQLYEIRTTRTIRGSQVEVVARGFPGGFIVIETTFSPKNVGTSAKAQVIFETASGKTYEAGRVVEFKDDGRVIGYGDTTHGVRFLRHPGEIKQARALRLSVWSG